MYSQAPIPRNEAEKAFLDLEALKAQPSTFFKQSSLKRPFTAKQRPIQTGVNMTKKASDKKQPAFELRLTENLIIAYNELDELRHYSSLSPEDSAELINTYKELKRRGYHI